VEQLLVKASRGALLYSEIRVSQGKTFNFYKFRIFTQLALKNAPREGGVMHTKPLERNKQNLTYYGRFLKQVYLDELPQLYNVLKGDMTLVGPRPTNTINSQRMKDRGYYAKEIMKCGITGLVQANKDQFNREGVDFDLKYINYCFNHTGWQIVINDFKILWQTIFTILRHKGI
jgi:lipopolysaccharide/colanic/teichoic acid biosynthesis glycosyltransferase